MLLRISNTLLQNHQSILISPQDQCSIHLCKNQLINQAVNVNCKLTFALQSCVTLVITLLH